MPAKFRRVSLVIMIVLILPLFLVACSSSASPTPTQPPAPTELATFLPGPTAPMIQATSTAAHVAADCVVPKGNSQGFLNLAEYQVALACTVNLFQWPPGKVPDINSFTDRNPDAANAGYQRGLEHVALGKTNMCAWYMTWLDARQRGDTATEAQALDMITNVIPNFAKVIPGYPADAADPSVISGSQDRAAKAALGDPTPIQLFVTYNCQSLVWLPAS